MKLFFLLTVFLFMASPLVASSSSTTTPQVTATVHLASVNPDSLQLIWRFVMQDRWYLYAPYRNDTGFPPSVTMALPDGWKAGPLQFPVPQRKILPGHILDHVYHDELLVTQTIDRGATPETGFLTAQLHWLACRDLCVPGHATFSIPIDAAPDSTAAELWERARRGQPAPFPDGIVLIERTMDSIKLTVPTAHKMVFIPGDSGPLLANLLHEGVREGDSLILQVRPNAKAQDPLDGLLSINYKDGPGITGTIRIP
jgi:DsbC/DsbD-like thiol-disulfide interchange protein